MSEFNSDELYIPESLNEDFFRAVIGKCEGKGKFTEQKIKIFSYAISPASQKGDHYASIMFRATIHYSVFEDAPVDKSKTVIIKTLPGRETSKGKNLSGTLLFHNEWRMYAKIIPQLEAVWSQYGEDIKFAGRLLYAVLQPHPVIVLEDLCLSGYDILRGRLFNLNEVKACLSKLAKWHAVSRKATASTARDSPQPNQELWKQDEINEEVGGSIRGMQFSLFKAENLVRTDYLSGGMRSLCQALAAAGGFEKYLPRLSALEPQVIAGCEAMNDAYAKGVAGPVYVLNHGDFHTKNIMIKQQESGTIEDMLFIDFQLSFFGPSTYDLIYSSFTLLSKDIRDSHREELLAFYNEELITSLRKLDFRGDLPNMTLLKADQRRWRFFELFMISTFLPLTQLNAQKANDVDINAVFDDVDYRQGFYTNADFIHYLRQIMPYYAELGCLD